MIIGEKVHRRRRMGLGQTPADLVSLSSTAGAIAASSSGYYAASPDSSSGGITPWWCGNAFTESIVGTWKGTAATNAICYPNLPPPVAPAAPSTPQQMTGADTWTPDQAIQATYAAQQQQLKGFFMNFGTGTTSGAAPTPSKPPSTSLCSLIFGTSIAGQIGQALCPLVMIVGGVAAIALLSFIFIEKR